MAASEFFGSGVSPYEATTSPPSDGEVVTWSDALGAWTNSVGVPGSGDVTASGVLANNAIALGGGTTVVKTTTTGTGVVTALGVNVGSAGAFVVLGGALGTPSSGVATNLTGTAAGLTAGVASAVAVGGITGLGTNVATALAVNIGSAGAPVLFNGAGGTPSSLVGTNITGTAAGLTAGTASAVAVGGITGLGAGVGTFLATPSSANLAAALTDETGTGVAMFNDSPTFADDFNLVATGVKFSAANGVLTLLGLGDGSDESLLIDLNTTANQIALSSGSGATVLSWAQFFRTGSATNPEGLAALESVIADDSNQYNFQLTNLAAASGMGLYAYVADTGVAGVESAGGYNFSGGGVEWSTINATNAAIFNYVTTLVTASADYSTALRGFTSILSYDDGTALTTYGIDTISDITDATITAYAAGNSSYVLLDGSSTAPISAAYYAKASLGGTANVPSVSAFYASAPGYTGTPTNDAYYSFYGVDVLGVGSHPYFLWYDGGPGGDANGAGVWRVNEFGIMAYYNPAFAKYTPGATNFERMIFRFGDTGVYGTDNIAYIGMEVGGTGTNRNLNILGAEVGIMTIPGTYGVIRAGGYKSSDGSAGATGTATAANTLTIKDGLVTVIA